MPETKAAEENDRPRRHERAPIDKTALPAAPVGLLPAPLFSDGAPLRRLAGGDAPRSGQVSPGAFQREHSLQVGAADDAAERAADRVADSVLDMLRRTPDTGGATASDAPGGGARPVARAEAGPEVGRAGGWLSPELSTRIEAASATGRPLPAALRRHLEPAFGSGLGRVRIHDDERAAELSRSVAARAFTHGDSIFFGAGEYRPDTPEGQQMLVHELAHTQQSGGAARRISRRWDLNEQRIPWWMTRGVRTLERNPIWFFADPSGDEIVVKPESQPVGLSAIVGHMHRTVGKTDAVQERKLSAGDRGSVRELIENELEDNNGDPSWVRRGRMRGARNGTDMEARAAAGTDVDLQMSAGNLLAMTVAPGQTAEAVAGQTRPGAGGALESELRTVLQRPGHLRKLGEVTAIDLFMGNKDRVFAGNLGNWFYDPDGQITLIDHVDKAQDTMAKDFGRAAGPGGDTWQSRNMLASGGLARTTADALQEVLAQARRESGDAEIDGAWLEEILPNGKTRGAFFATEFLAGLREGRKHIIKVFSATRLNVFRRSSRQTKKNIKAVAQQAREGDAGHDLYGQGSAPDYYEVLKARARWLAKN